jgi:hypothetical protein
MPEEKQKEYADFVAKIHAGLVFLGDAQDKWSKSDVWNLHISRCYNCRKFAVWICDKLVFPAHKTGPTPNPDLPEEIIRDFEEGRGIVDESPRGAAALLRLCIQKLCKHLGESGTDINNDIASLVGKGLDPLIQQSLDIVRVIGNESVHPGTIDLRDDRDTAVRLFDLVNAIAEQLISHPKRVKEMYGRLPEAKRNAIDDRNRRAQRQALPAPTT